MDPSSVITQVSASNAESNSSHALVNDGATPPNAAAMLAASANSEPNSNAQIHSTKKGTD